MPTLNRCQLVHQLVWYAAASPAWPSLLAYLHATTALLADTVKGGELGYTTLAMEREQTACSSLLRLMGAVLADPEPMPARLVRGCTDMASTASVPADQSSPALLIPSRAANSATWYCRLNASTARTARY